MDKEYCYSLDEETYYLDTEILDVISDQYEEGETVRIYLGTVVRYSYCDFINGWEIIETMREIAFEEVGEVSDNFLDKLDSAEDIKELERHIEKFFNDKLGPVKFFGSRIAGEFDIKAGDTSFLKRFSDNE